MALTAPSYSGPRMDGLPFAPAAVEDDSAAFAGVGKALGALPAVVADAAAKQRAVCDRAAVKAATNKARTQMLSGMEEIAGGDGTNAAARATDLVEKIRKDAGPAVTAVPERAGMYDYAANAMADTYTLLARRREVRGAREADRAAVREEQDILLSETKAIWQANGAASSGPDGEVLVDTDGTVLPPVNPGRETARRALRARENAAHLAAAEGASPDEQEAAADAAEVQVHMAAIGALTPDNPRAALEYLAQTEVKAVVPEADWKNAEARAKKIITFSDDNALADQLAEKYDDAADLAGAVADVMPDAGSRRQAMVMDRAADGMRRRTAAAAVTRREVDDGAVAAMEAAGWSLSAISPDWPEDLQDKMAAKVRARKKPTAAAVRAERKALGLEYLSMTPEELDAKILAGEWTDMLESVGPTSPEGRALIKLANGDNPASRAGTGGRGGRTMLQYAAAEYERLVGNPRSKKNKVDYANFIAKVDEEREALAAELGVEPRLIPNSKQKEIINKWLVNGDWRWYDDFPLNFSKNVHRYNVAAGDLSTWKPFATSLPDNIPEFAHAYFSPRDSRREVLPSGQVLIEGPDGVATVINPDGSIEGGR